MLKIYSVCGFAVVLVSSIAQAPSRSTPVNLVGQSAIDTAAFNIAADASSAGHRSHARMFADFGDLERFSVDELNLPKLNVELPALFDWSNAQRSYLAFNETEFEAVSSEYDSASHWPVVQFANAGSSSHDVEARSSYSRAGFGGGRAGGGSPFAGISSKHTSNGAAPAVTTVSTDTEPQSVAAARPVITEVTHPALPSPSAATGSPSIPQTTYPPEYYRPIGADSTAIESETAIPVPVPGSLGLFALGLIGLHLAGRKKKGNG